MVTELGLRICTNSGEKFSQGTELKILAESGESTVLGKEECGDLGSRIRAV